MGWCAMWCSHRTQERCTITIAPVIATVSWCRWTRLNLAPRLSLWLTISPARPAVHRACNDDPYRSSSRLKPHSKYLLLKNNVQNQSVKFLFRSNGIDSLPEYLYISLVDGHQIKKYFVFINVQTSSVKLSSLY